MGTNWDTVRSYVAVASKYVAAATAMPAWLAEEIDVLVAELGGLGRVLEIGSGGGRDARELEKRGISVRRTGSNISSSWKTGPSDAPPFARRLHKVLSERAPPRASRKIRSYFSRT